LGDLGGYVVVGIVLIGVLEVIVSLASRRLLVARAGLLPDGPGERTETRLAVAGASRLVRHPFRVLRVALVSWSVALGTLLVGAVSVTLAWTAIRPGLQALVVSSDPARLVGAPIAV